MSSLRPSDFAPGDYVEQTIEGSTYRGIVQHTNEITGSIYVRWHRGYACWIVVLDNVRKVEK